METTFIRKNENGLPSYHIQIPAKYGYWVIDTNYDPEYPGVDVEYIPNGFDSEGKMFTRPRVLIEEPNEDSKVMRALIWTDPEKEDYTEKVVFSNRSVPEEPSETNSRNTEVAGSTCNRKYFLVFSDGYDIKHTEYPSYDDAFEAMTQQYSEYDIDEEWKDESCLGEWDAILYHNGEDVFVWHIISA